MPKTYFISGASKGIGAEFARQLLTNEPESVVIGASRNPDSSDELKELGDKYGDRLKTVALDMTDLEGIKAVAKEVEGLAPGGIDVVRNPPEGETACRNAADHATVLNHDSSSPTPAPTLATLTTAWQTSKATDPRLWAARTLLPSR
jgi:NAD(P)-dependent dehydrogenase (short-subunit alcohol dehydrogenase family)